MAPSRSYYCIACNGWHVTSNKEEFRSRSRTEKVLDFYHENKQKISLWRQKNNEVRKARKEKLLRMLDSIDARLIEIEKAVQNRNSEHITEMLNKVSSDFESIQREPGYNPRKRAAGEKIKLLKDGLSSIIP